DLQLVRSPHPRPPRSTPFPYTTLFRSGVSGEAQEVSIFVAALGASQLIYAEAVPGEDLHSWLGLHQRTFEFLGGVPAVVVPDNLDRKSTRLNSSHVKTSYAVCCLKKKR